MLGMERHCVLLVSNKLSESYDQSIGLGASVTPPLAKIRRLRLQSSMLCVRLLLAMVLDLLRRLHEKSVTLITVRKYPIASALDRDDQPFASRDAVV
jgi:hypothetical protein